MVCDREVVVMTRKGTRICGQRCADKRADSEGRPREGVS